VNAYGEEVPVKFAQIHKPEGWTYQSDKDENEFENRVVMNLNKCDPNTQTTEGGSSTSEFVVNWCYKDASNIEIHKDESGGFKINIGQ
jgi:hypothetical protein